MSRIIVFLTISVFLFSGLIQGPICNMMKRLDLENDGYLAALTFDTVAWAKDKDEKDKKDKDPIATPAPGAAILIVLGIAAVAVALRKKLKK